jgi:hypothetical protein
MVNMAPLGDEQAEGTEEEELELELETEETSPEESEEQPDEISVLRAEIDNLKQAPPWLNDLKTVQGRIAAVEARLTKSDDPATRQELLRELRSELGKSTDLYAEALSGLDETAFTDPAVKQRLNEALAQRRAEEARAALRDEVLAELKPAAPAAPVEDYRQAESTRVWETTWADVITDAGLDPDSPELGEVWKGVSPHVVKGDFKAANEFMKSSLASLRAEVEVAAKRQNAKRAGGKSPKPAEAGEIGPLDASRPSEDRIAYLRSIGAI